MKLSTQINLIGLGGLMFIILSFLLYMHGLFGIGLSLIGICLFLRYEKL